MLPIRLESLAEVFAQVPDPRKPRDVRHPMAGMLALVFLGLLARIRELAELQRWAETRWDQLGFEREKPPHATKISRAIAGCELSKFAEAFLAWVKTSLIIPSIFAFGGSCPWVVPTARWNFRRVDQRGLAGQFRQAVEPYTSRAAK